MDKPWKVISAFIGVFVAGAVFGGFFTLRLEHPAPPPTVVVRETPVPAPQPATGATTPAAQPPQATPPQPPRGIAPGLMKQFTQRLNPTPAQRKQILPVVSRAADDLQRLQRENLQDTTRVMERMYEDVSAVLSPEQRANLEKMRQETLERTRKLREKHGEAQGKAGVLPANARKANTVEGPNPAPGKDQE